MKNLLLLLCCVIGSHVLGQQTVINDANAETRTIGAFTGIRVSDGITLYLSQSSGYSLAVSASDSASRAEITTVVRDHILYISVAGKPWKHWHGRDFRVYVSFTELENLEASGACSVYINGTLHANTLRTRLSGASTLDGNISVGTLSFELSGASVARLTGDAQNVKIDASGASDVKSFGLKSQNCMAALSGASDVRLSIAQSVVATASGASTLYFDGSPEKREVRTSGASSISQKSE